MSFSGNVGGSGGGHHHRCAHLAPAFALADQPPAKRMRTDNNASQNDTCARSASSTSSPFPFSSPFQPSGTQAAHANGKHSHPSFIISPDRDCKFGAGQFAPIACAQHSNGGAASAGGSSFDANLNSPAPAAAAALWFGATSAPAAEGGAVMQITQDSVSDIDEPPPSMHECESNKEQTPREWWKQPRPAATDGAGIGTARSSSTTSAAAAAAVFSALSASSSFSSLAPHGAAVTSSAAAARCHVCNVNEAPPLQSSDHAESYASAGTGAGTAAHHHPSHSHGSPYVAKGLSHHSPAFHAAGHQQHGSYQNQHLPQAPATTAGATTSTRQKNSLLSYFQVRKPPAVCSTPSRPTSSVSSGAANSSTPHPHTHSPPPPPMPTWGRRHHRRRSSPARTANGRRVPPAPGTASPAPSGTAPSARPSTTTSPGRSVCSVWTAITTRMLWQWGLSRRLAPMAAAWTWRSRFVDKDVVNRVM